MLNILHLEVWHGKVRCRDEASKLVLGLFAGVGVGWWKAVFS